nr:A disintegrin and metalloproteinase with thrombospondin motifs 7 [Nothobranchius furzeri]
MSRLDCGLRASGQRASPIQVLIALLVLEGCGTLGLSDEPAFPEGFQHNLHQFEVVHPVRVDARGHFLSNFLAHHAHRVQRREASEENIYSDQVFYRFLHHGHSLHFNLTLNPNLLAPGFMTERRYGGLQGAKISQPEAAQCHYLGEVWDETTVKGSAAISTCDGLTGLFKFSEEEFFIQPLEKLDDEISAPQAHAIYKRHTSPPFQGPVLQNISGKQALNGTCGNQNSHHSFEESERRRERWEYRHQRRSKRVRQRSVSKEKWVETLVVADPKMVDYHGSKAVESYVLAVMNIVAGLFKDATIGNAINIVIVRLILLEQDEDDLKITHHADNSLNSFCKWQKKLNMKGDEHPLHHDVAVLLTRKDICAAVNKPCETLGLSHVAGMCQPHRSCSISEDTGLPMAFTVAHELGHNFGIQHDGNGNDCEPIGKRPFVMSPQLLYGTFLPRWSCCSRQYITHFLDRGWGWCLDDAPVKDGLSLTSILPGVLYSAVHQCRLQYGSGSRLCDDMDNVCSTLWCTVGTTCHSKLDGAVDGTSCGEDKWCVHGECLPVGYHPESVNGGWAPWSEWSVCSRTCGSGVQSAQRDCDDPVPKYRGKYCLGERLKYRICNIDPCPHDQPTFRHAQCAHFNSLSYKGKLYKWEAVINKANPCELHCRPLNEHFSEKMRDAVTDGTPCYEGNKSRDMCIGGICQNIGCDYVINSGSVEDRCGVCNGNGSTCTTVRRTFEQHEGIGYIDIGLIPEGAWNILIEEVAEAGNYLALRSDNPGQYYLNGGWTIQWNGEYKAAGTVFTYERSGDLENLTSPGPTMEPMWIQLLFQETNPGIRYEYTISRNISEDNNIPGAVYFWKYGSWTECSVTCGTGFQQQIVYCVERTTGIAEQHLCDSSTQPDNNQTSCNKDPCPATWLVGDWHKCSASCGSSGLAERTVLCIQAVSADEQKALDPGDCEHLPKPKSISACNTHIPCPADWITGSWSKCSQTCGTGFRHRNVTCSRNTGADCDPQNKPLSASTCSIKDCTQIVDNFGSIEWSGSGWSSNEVFNEINPIPEDKPPPKFSISRSQPRTHTDIIEGDFHYHNNIENNENTQKISVHVDDFYYDYNFINFHEDLSNDFESYGEVSEGRHGSSDPQETKPTQREKERTLTDPTVSTVYTLKTTDHQSTNKDDEKSSAQDDSENLDDFLYDDHLLPVSVTHPSPPSPTLSSRKVEVGKGLLWAESTSITPGPAYRMKQLEQEEVWGQSREEAENNDDSPREEENQSNNFTVTPTHGAPTSRHKNTNVAAYQEHTESPKLLDSSILANKTQVITELYENSSEIPLTTSQTADLKTALDINQDQVASSGGSMWDSSSDLSTASPPFPIPHLISGNIATSPTSADSTALTGTEARPAPNLQGVTEVPLTDLQTATMEHTHPSLGDTTGTDFTFQPSSFHLADLDFDETLIPSVVRSSISSHSSTSTVTSANSKLRSAQHMKSPTPAASILPTPAPSERLNTVQTSASTQLSGAAFWIAGNWSACSTSCGLGAIWRTLTCSTGSESDCNPAKRPAPARQCYLRPCSMWKVGEWSKCSKNCEGGIRFREVQCFDLRDQRALRPFHCQAVSTRPPSEKPCNAQLCLDWYTSSWGQCSEVCGGGEQQRIVTCPEDDRCHRDLQPRNIQSCNSQPCAQWLTGLWEECSASCGGGVQHRLIKCVDTKAETQEMVEPSQCDLQLKPNNTQRCNLHNCESTPSATLCHRDRLTFRFCQTLRSLGRCLLPNVQMQCCKTCNQRSHPSRTSRQQQR